MSGFQRKFPTKTAAAPAAPATPPPAKKEGGFERVGAAWYTKSKNGVEYVRVKLDDGTVLNMFVNDHKKKDSDPDFSVTKSPTK